MNQFEMKQRAYQSSLKSRALQVLLYLIDRTNREQTCFPVVPTIGRELHISISTVKRAMKELVESGYVTKESRFRDGNRGQTSNLYTLFFPEREPEQEKKEDHAEHTEPETVKAEELAGAAESTGAQQDVELEAGEMFEPEQAEDVAEPKEKAGYAELVADAVTSVRESKNENVSGEAAVYDRDSVFSYNVDGGGVHSAIPLNCPFNQKLKAKKKYYREFRGRIFGKMAEAVKKWLFPGYSPHPEKILQSLI